MRTFDLALQVACPASENEGEPSFLNFYVLHMQVCFKQTCSFFLSGKHPSISIRKTLLNLYFKLLFGIFLVVSLLEMA